MLMIESKSKCIYPQVVEEIHIKSAFEFLGIMHDIKISRRREEHASSIEMFRGHADSTWKIIPTLFRWIRKDGQKNPIMLSFFEMDLIEEFARLHPDEFPSELPTFDRIAKMQHYGMLTRLLDVTFNPAVALYFACCDLADESNSKQGEVLLFQSSLNDISDNATINLIADYCVTPSYYRDTVAEYYNQCLRSHPTQFVDEAFKSFIMLGELFARPKLISERMIRQAGCFMFCTGRVCPDSGCCNRICTQENCQKRKGPSIRSSSVPIEDQVKHFRIERMYDDPTNYHYGYHQDAKRYLIDPEYKKTILSVL